MIADVSPDDARRAWRALEVVHGMIYFAPEADEEYQAVGIEPGRMGYFASRAAPMGAVTGEVVIATFFNFEPSMVLGVIPRAWTLVTPGVVLDARRRAADAALRRMLGDETVSSPDVEEAAALARRAAEACTSQGRPLYAGHASLPWPDEPHLVLWHAQSLLREYRGDAHVAALMLEGLSGLGALVQHAGTGLIPAEVLRTTRAWSKDAWAAEVATQQEQGWIDADGKLVGAGAAMRDRVESATDRATVDAYAAIGVDGCARLRDLGKQLSRQIMASGGLPGR